MSAARLVAARTPADGVDNSEPPRLLPAGAIADLVCAVLACAVAVGAVLALRARVSGGFNRSADIIGYPLFNAFDPAQYATTYYVIVLAGPLVALATFALTRWGVGVAVPRLRAPLPSVPPLRRDRSVAVAAERAAPPLRAAGAMLRVVAPGSILGMELAVDRDARGLTFWAYTAAVAAGYTCGVLLIAALASTDRLPMSRRATYADMLSAINALGACLPVVGLWGLSRATVVITSDGAVHHYAWLRLSVTLALGLGLAGVVGISLWWRRTLPGWRAIVERRSVMLIAVPCLLLIWLTSLFDPAGQVMPSFEFGQQIGTVNFLQDGLVPWRDFFTDHGLLEDTLKYLPGSWLVDNTAWGMVAGLTLLVTPLCYIALYLFAYKLGGGFAFPLAVAVMFFHRSAVYLLPRFVAWPLILVLLWAVLDRRSPRWACALGLSAIAMAVLTPEAAYCVIAVGAAVLVHDLYRADPSRGRRLRSFSLFGGLVVGCAVGLLMLLVFLLATGGLGGYIGYFRAALPGHDLTGGTPMEPLVPPLLTWAALPVAGVLAAVAILAVKLWSRVVLATEDFVMVAATVMTFLYYPKFLARAEAGHALQVYAVALPLLLIVAHQLLVPADRAARWLGHRLRLHGLQPPATAAALLVAVATAPTGLWHTADASSDRIRVQVPVTAIEWPRMGWFAAQQPLFRDMDAFLQAYLNPGDRVFDFTNSPGLVYVALDYQPAAHNITAASAPNQAAQNDLIGDLEKSRPKLILFWTGNVSGSLVNWDGIPNMVRHYQVSQWILDHYHPLAAVDTNVLYAVNGATVPDPATQAPRLVEPLVTQNLYFEEQSCDWGYAPQFLNIAHPAESSAVDLGMVGTAPGSLTISPPAGHVWSDYTWIEIQSAGAGFHADTFTIDDHRSGGRNRSVTFRTRDGADPIYRVPIGSCSQWHGYGTAPLTISHQPGDPLVSVRLLP